jgi:hypothetical protein
VPKKTKERRKKKTKKKGTFGHIPHPNGFIFRVGQNQIRSGMK